MRKKNSKVIAIILLCLVAVLLIWNLAKEEIYCGFVFSLPQSASLTARCGEPGRGSGCSLDSHSLPRLRFAFPRQREPFCRCITKTDLWTNHRSVSLFFGIYPKVGGIFNTA